MYLYRLLSCLFGILIISYLIGVDKAKKCCFLRKTSVDMYLLFICLQFVYMLDNNLKHTGGLFKETVNDFQ